MQVADHQQLHPAEWQIIAAVAAQHGIHRVEQIGPYHTYFINHQQIKAFDNSPFFFAEPELALLIAFICLAARHKWTKGQLEKKNEV